MTEGGAKRREKPAKPVLEAISGERESKFSRALGSTDYHTREAGLQALATWLARKQDVEELDLLKLWKGIFYCFWHSDKTAVQTALAERLSEIMMQLPEQVGWLYYQTFIRTMRREWAGIDRLRLDKFMMLVRKVFSASLRQLQQHAWQQRRVQRLADFWLREVLLPQDTLVAAGVAYHFTDLLLAELSKCVADGGASSAPLGDATLRTLLEPFCAALAEGANPALLYRLRQGVFDPLVEEVRQPGEAAPLRQLDVAALAAHLFDLGARPETRARNREALYSISAALEKAAAKRQRKEQQQNGQAQQRQEQRHQEAEEGQATPVAKAAKGKEGKRQRQQQEQQQRVQQQQAEDAAVEQQQQTAPGSVKAGKKKRQAAEQGSTPGAGVALQRQQQAAAGPAVQPQAAGGEPHVSGKKKRKKSLPGAAAGRQEAQQEQNGAAAAAQQTGVISEREHELLSAALAAVTGSASTPAAADGTPGGASPGKKKNVRFSLKRNLVNVIGQPPKPEDVRTPPTAKPKGPALKKESAFGGPASAPERLLTRAGKGRAEEFRSYMNGRAAAQQAAASASKAEGSSNGAAAAGARKQKRRASLPSPGSFSRPRATDFF